MDIFTKEYGNRTNFFKEHYHIVMVISMMESLKIFKEMVMEHISIRTKPFTVDIGKTI